MFVAGLHKALIGFSNARKLNKIRNRGIKAANSNFRERVASDKNKMSYDINYASVNFIHYVLT